MIECYHELDKIWTWERKYMISEELVLMRDKMPKNFRDCILMFCYQKIGNDQRMSNNNNSNINKWDEENVVYRC